MRKLSVKPVMLSPERLAILLALAHRPMSAPDLAGQVIADTVGAVTLHPGSHYRLLHDLSRRGYITDGPLYDLNSRGWGILEQEIGRAHRYHQLLQIRLSPRQYRGTPPSN